MLRNLAQFLKLIKFSRQQGDKAKINKFLQQG